MKSPVLSGAQLGRSTFVDLRVQVQFAKAQTMRHVRTLDDKHHGLSLLQDDLNTSVALPTLEIYGPKLSYAG
jgi:hypothetical protein